MNPKSVTFTFLGTGSAFTVGHNNYHSNILISCDNSNLLVDCGSDIRFSLHEQNLDFNTIDEVYISHLHADHAGGLEWLGFNRKFNSKLKKPILRVSYDLVKKLWNNVLSGGMSSLPHCKATLNSFFRTKIIAKDRQFTWKHLKFKLVKTVHYQNNNRIAPSYGLFIYCNKTKIFITTDTQFDLDGLMKHYLEADLIFQDCDVAKKHAAVHATYTQLATLNPTIKAKMWLYHYCGNNLPDAQEEGFKGFVKKGQKFIVKC